MAIDAVVTGIEPTAGEPFPEGWMTGVKRHIPALVPVEKICVLLKALWKLIEAKAVEDNRVFQVGLRNECFWRANIVLFLPVDCNLGLRNFRGSILRHGVASRVITRLMQPYSPERKNNTDEPQP